MKTYKIGLLISFMSCFLLNVILHVQFLSKYISGRGVHQPDKYNVIWLHVCGLIKDQESSYLNEKLSSSLQPHYLKE